MSPAEIAADALQIGVRDVITVEPIKHGLTNASWLVRCAHDTVVVRISNTAVGRLQIDRHSEAAILRTVADAGIGAPVLLCDPQQRVLVTRYLGPTWSEHDARQPAGIARLAAILRHLHELRPEPGVRRIAPLTVVNGYLQTLAGTAFKEDLARSEHARRIATLLDGRGALCLCHNDVHCLNIVDAGGVRLIDWEYAGIGTPLFDLASVCVSHRYDESQRNQLLSAYARPDIACAEWLDQACELFAYVSELWTQVRGL